MNIDKNFLQKAWNSGAVPGFKTPNFRISDPEFRFLQNAALEEIQTFTQQLKKSIGSANTVNRILVHLSGNSGSIVLSCDGLPPIEITPDLYANKKEEIFSPDNINNALATLLVGIKSKNNKDINAAIQNFLKQPTPQPV